MLSGIGPAEHLKEHKIELVQDLPGVGQHLVDHPALDIAFKDKKNSSSKHLKPKTFWDVFKLLGAVYEFYTSHTGVLTSNVSHFVFLLQI